MTLLQTAQAANRFCAGAGGRAQRPQKIVKKFSLFAKRPAKNSFYGDLLLLEGEIREASDSGKFNLTIMTKSRPFLAIRVAFFALLLCLVGTLPSFATDGIYTQFGLDLGYAGRIGYLGGTTPEWAIYVYGAGTAGSRFNALNITSPPNATGLQVDGDIGVAGV